MQKPSRVPPYQDGASSSSPGEAFVIRGNAQVFSSTKMFINLAADR